MSGSEVSRYMLSSKIADLSGSDVGFLRNSPGLVDIVWEEKDQRVLNSKFC